MALLTPPPAAPQRGDRTTFANRVDAFITWLINFVSELVSLVANLNSIAAGGAYAIPYTNVSSIAQIGAAAGGKICINNDTDLRLDTKDARGASVAGLLNQMNSSSSTVKGTIRIFAVADPSRWIDYNITSYAQNAGGLYGAATMAFVNSSSGGNPLLANEMVMLDFQRTGDKGDTGANGTSLTPILWVRDEKPSGTQGPAPTFGYNVRTLNTVTRNTITGASLSSNRITLPAGTYRYWGSVPAFGVGAHQGLIYNITDSIALATGGSEYSSGSAATRSFFASADMTISKTTVFELRHWSATTSGSLGSAVGAGVNEVYSELVFEKIA